MHRGINIDSTPDVFSYLLDFYICSFLVIHLTLGFPTTDRANGEEAHQLASANNEFVRRATGRKAKFTLVQAITVCGRTIKVGNNIFLLVVTGRFRCCLCWKVLLRVLLTAHLLVWVPGRIVLLHEITRLLIFT